MLNIVVFIKQVPDTNDVKWTENNNIDRASMDSIMNPVDREAIEAAVRIKEQYSAHTTAITMGPKKSIEVLKEAIAMGIDDAALLCDSKFSGSDTCATSKVLASAIKEKFPNTDLIIFGQSSIDGETSQTGPSTATRIDYPFLTHVSEIMEISEEEITVTTENDIEKNTYTITLPACICINNYIYPPRNPMIKGYINSQKYFYKDYNIYELKLSENDTGLKGSPTYVSKVYKTAEGRNCKIYNKEEYPEYYKDVIALIKGVC